ncbi:hypothetical protein Tco_1154634 [Tanacetum coccineum]
MNFLSESLTARIKEQVKDQLPQILPQEVSNFAPLVIKKLIKESRDEVNLAKVSSQSHSSYEAYTCRFIPSPLPALRAYYAEVRISNQTSVARSSQQNGVVERWNFDTMASEQFSSAPEPKLITPGTISLGLVQNIPSPTPHCPITCYSTSTSSSTIIDQDAPPTSTSQTTQETASMKEGKCCVKNYSSMRRYIADPDNAYPKRSITKLILKGAVIFDVVSYQFRCALNYSKLIQKILCSSSGFMRRFFVHQRVVRLLLLGKLVFVDDDGKPLKKVDYPDNLGSGNEVEPVDNG